MKTLTTLLTIVTALFIAACVNNHSMQLAGNEDDEFGIGGTGIMAGNQQGTGIIGQITGYGSIFVNGIEVETNSKATISIDGIIVKGHDFKIGEVVEVLTRDTNPHTSAQYINIRHEVIGPVSHYDKDKATAVILGQTIHLSDNINSGIAVGDRLAVSGFTDPSGLINATHIRHTSGSHILLRATILSDGNNLSLNNIPLSSSTDKTSGSEKSAVHGVYKNGTISTTSIADDQSLPFNKVAKWVIQGYASNYASHWNINSANLHGLESNKTIIFEVNQPNSSSATIKLLSKQKLPTGSGNKPSFQRNSTPARSSQPGRQSGSGGRGKR